MLIFDNRSVIICVKSKSKVKREDSKIFASSSPSPLLQDFTDIIKYCTSSPVLVLPRRLSAGEGINISGVRPYRGEERLTKMAGSVGEKLNVVSRAEESVCP